MKVRLFHYGDIQVIVRNKNLESSYEANLSNIENEIESNHAEVVIVPGDLFEIAEANDAERKLIYQHLGNICKLDCVKELVIMIGNHDMVASNYEGNNAIDTFVALMNVLGLADKIIYLKERKNYKSKFPIEYVSYSLENKLKENFNFESDNFLISTYHDILIDYVEDSKLPVSKKVMERLLSMDSFHTPLILSADIHEFYYKEKDGKQFYYPGSTHQRNYGEGTYLNIRKQSTLELADVKCCLLHTIDTDTKTVETEKIWLDTFTSYITIDFNTVSVVPEFLKELEKGISAIELGKINTFVKLILSTAYVESELSIISKVKELIPNVVVETKYDKVISKNTEISNVLGAEYLKEIVANNPELSEAETIEEYVNESNLSQVFDNIVLTKESLITLFEKCIENNKVSLLKELNDEKILEDVIEDIRSLFAEQIEISMGAVPNFNIELEGAGTNGFMSMGKNDINLLIPGLIRILASNGVGKTTLYHLIRWVINGKVFENLRDNTKSQNDLLVFNDTKPFEDYVNGYIIGKVNGTQIKIEREATRVWKKIPDSEKSKPGWQKHIASVSRSLKLTVYKADGSKVVKIGDEAENLIRQWFGDVINTITIFDQFKIKSMLNAKPEELGQMILNFIGIDYLNLLKSNLDIVKSRYETAKPKQNKESLLAEMSDLENKIDTIKTSLLGIDKKISDVESLISSQEKILNEKNNQLINLGNVPLTIDNTISDITNLQTKINNFEKQDLKEIPTFEPTVYKKPEVVVIDDSEINSIKQNIESINETIKNETIKFKETNAVKVDKLTSHAESRLTIIQEEYAEKFRNERDKQTQILNDKLNVINIEISEFESKLATEEQIVNEQVLSNATKNARIKQLREEIESGICSGCNRALEGHDPQHIENEISQIVIEPVDFTVLNQLKSKIKELQDSRLLVKLDDELMNQYKIVVANTSSKNWEYFDGVNFEENLLQFIQKVIELKNQQPTFDDLENNRKVLVNRLSEIESEHKLIFDTNQKLMDEYYANISIEQQRVSDYQTTVTKINQHNSGVAEHNQLLTNWQMELLTAQQYLSKLQNDRKEYDVLVSEYNIIKAELKLADNEINNLKNNNLNFDLGIFQQKLAETNQKYMDYLKYQKDIATFNMYKKIIEKDFKDSVFGYYRNFLNITFNLLLADLNFKLIWHESGDLYYYKAENGTEVYRVVQAVSGMETCFLGLALLYAIHTLNVKYNISHIFIDEISGQLNSGKDIENATNYQEQLLLLLSKFKDKKIFIVDHVIGDMFQTATYLVEKTSEGAKYSLL